MGHNRPMDLLCGDQRVCTQPLFRDQPLLMRREHCHGRIAFNGHINPANASQKTGGDAGNSIKLVE
jgi:hypothetical protein